MTLKCEVPVEIVHYPVKQVEAEDLDVYLEYDFNYLLVSQWGPRKNIENAIKWWIEENYDEKVGLVLKTSLKNNSILDREHIYKNLKAIVSAALPADAKCKIYLLHGDMSDGEMVGLYTHPKIKALISISHGEGYGLPLFESAHLGLPIVATNWSGQCDFLNMPSKRRKKGSKKRTETVNKPMIAEVEYSLAPIQKEAVWDGVLQADSMWCYADKDSYQKAIGNVYENYPKYKKMATELKDWVRKEFEAEKQYDAFANAVLPDLKDVPVEEMLVSFD